jgi:hypothetical protein
MRSLWTTWRRESRRHPSVLVLTVTGLSGFALGAVLIAAGAALLGQLVAGLGVAPLALALYLCLLPAGPWLEDDGGGGRGPGDGPPAPPAPRDGPGADAHWERFEREFWAHVDERVPVA